jgi:hypothetical protein
MQIKLTKQNIDDVELAKALAGIATEEGVGHEVHELLSRMQKSDQKDSGEKIPEKYMRVIGDKLLSEFKALMNAVSDNVEVWINHQGKIEKSFLKSLRKSESVPPVLTQEQIDEMKALIQAHFRSAIGLGYTVSETTLRKWQRMGIDPKATTNESISTWIERAYVAGRLANVLDNNTTFTQFWKLAKDFTMSRQDQLVLEMSKLNSARFIVGYAEKLGGLATDVALDQHKKAINSVIQSYFNETLTTEAGESGIIGKVTSWRELASELRNRFRQTDLVRDWERVAFTEMRYATNLGRIMNIQHEGGGDAEDIEVFYHVLPTACNSCKKLYLEADGKTPKIFKLSEILKNVQETGGMNIGLKASDIGGKDGWLPNASTHPNCHCYPVRKIGGYKYAEFQ